MYIVPNDATHAAVLILVFTDGGHSEESVLQFGSFEQCDEAARTLPAVAYKGDRPGVSASVSVFPLHPLCGVCGQRHDLMRPCGTGA